MGQHLQFLRCFYIFLKIVCPTLSDFDQAINVGLIIRDLKTLTIYL